MTTHFHPTDVYYPEAPRHLGLSLSIAIVVLMILALLVTAAVMAIQGDSSTAHGTATHLADEVAALTSG